MNINIKIKNFEKEDILTYKILAFNRITKVLKTNKQIRYRVLVIVGNKVNKIGFGLVKANELSVAIRKAILKAKKNVFKIKLTKEKTILYSKVIKYKSSKLICKPVKADYGLVANDTIKTICRLVGIRNVIIKSFGSRNIINMTKAIYFVLKQFELIE